MAHDQYVSARKRVGKEVSRIEAQTISKAVGGHIALENRAGGWKVEPATVQVRMPQRQLHRDTTLGGTYVYHAAVAIPGKLLRESQSGAHAKASHGMQELPKAAVVL